MLQCRSDIAGDWKEIKLCLLCVCVCAGVCAFTWVRVAEAAGRRGESLKGMKRHWSQASNA